MGREPSLRLELRGFTGRYPVLLPIPRDVTVRPMSSVVGFLLSAPGVVLVMVAGAIWLTIRPQSKVGRRSVLAVAALYFVASLYAVPFLAGRALLTRQLRPFEPTDVKSGRTAIVILGGGGATARLEDLRVGIMNQETAARMLEGYRVYRLIGAEWIISSGGLSTQATLNETSAEMMRDGLVQLGVPASRIVVESESRDTRDEAILIGPMLRRLGAENLVLVTSDIHMPRARAVFREEGWQPIPAIAPDARRPIDIRGWVTPTTHGLEYTEQVVHELLGIVYYRALAWSSAGATGVDSK